MMSPDIMNPSISLIIPIYTLKLDEDELISLRMNLRPGQFGLCAIVHPHSLLADDIDRFLMENQIPHDWVRYEEFKDSYFKGLKGYNRLLMSTEFYHRFSKHEYLLICQLDALLLADDFSTFVNKQKSVFGAPVPSEDGFGGYLPIFNGGFTLRNTKDALNLLKSREFFPDRNRFNSLRAAFGLKNLIILRSFFFFSRYFNLPWARCFVALTDINEDVFWSAITPFFSESFMVGDLKECRAFSFEKNPETEFRILGKLPAGAHAWYKYDKAFWTEKMAGLAGSQKIQP